MHFAAKIAKVGDRIISYVALLLILIMLLFGGYSLWDMYSTAHGAFVSDELLKYKPSEEDKENLSLLDLKKLNNDVSGWITIDQTHIDYPFVQGKDDMEYVNKNVYGEFSLSGAVFLSADNNPDFSDSYNVFYGHHIDGGAMFADVYSFENEIFFEEHKTGSLRTFHGNYKIEVFGVIKTDAYNRYVYRKQEHYNNKEQFQTLLDYLKEDCVHYRDIGVTKNDKIVALSTCMEATSYGRAVLFGKLVPDE